MAIKPTVRDIVVIASQISGQPITAIAGKSRHKPNTRVRQAVCLLASEQGHSTPHIGRILNRDHSTVCHGRNQAVNIAGRQPDYAWMLHKMRAGISEMTGPLDREWKEAFRVFPEPPKPSKPVVARPIIGRPKPIPLPVLCGNSAKPRNRFDNDEFASSAEFEAMLIIGSTKLADAINRERTA